MVKMECDVQATIRNIKRIMLERGINEAEMAREISISKQVLSKQLDQRRRTMPRLEWVYAISEVLDIPIQELIILKSKEADYMKLTDKKCSFYEYNERYGIEIMESLDPSGEEMWDAWLVEKDYGLKSYIIGLYKKNVPTIGAFLAHVLEDIETTIDLFEKDKILYESDPDIVLNRPVSDMFDDLLERTLNNCRFYEKDNQNEKLVNEVGCLRGILYCLEKVGAVQMNDEVTSFIDKANEFMKKS